MSASNAPVINGHGLLFPSPDAPAMLLGAPYGRFLALCHEHFLALAPSLRAELHPLHAQLVALMRRALAARPRAALACYASPTIGTALQCTRLAGSLPTFAPHIARAAERTLSHVALELAVRGLLPADTRVELPASLSPFTCPALGITVHAPPDVATVTLTAQGLTAPPDHALVFREPDAVRGFRVEPGYLRVGGVTRLALVDHNPIAAFEAHPDKHGNHVTLGDHPSDEWRASLDASFALIEAHTPELFHEMSGMLHEVVPVGFDLEKHLSASYREAIGTVYLTLHPHVMTMAEALIHEFQHNKLNLASYFEDFLVNAFSPLYKSPVRPDPRPLWGILLAVHAFLPIAVLYRRMRDAHHPNAQRPDFLARMDTVDLKNHEGMEMLRAHGEFTAAGRVLMRELDALSNAHMAERAGKGLAITPTDSHVA